MSRKQRRAEQHKNPQPIPQGGPRTPEGKAVSSQNAFSHGLTAARLVLPWENQTEFDSLLNQLVAEHQPATATEGILVREIAEQYWRLQRARNHEHALLSHLPEIVEQAEADVTIHEIYNKQVKLAERYVTRHERAFHKCLATLRTLQKERRATESEATEEAQEFVSQKPNALSPSEPRASARGEFSAPSEPRTLVRGGNEATSQAA